jgi:hypothetical protein
MRKILERLLSPSEPIRRFCTVEDVKPDGRYVVVDDLKRKFTIDGDAGYLPGQDVVVQNGRIVRRGRRKTAIKTYRV